MVLALKDAAAVVAAATIALASWEQTAAGIRRQAIDYLQRNGSNAKQTKLSAMDVQ